MKARLLAGLLICGLCWLACKRQKPVGQEASPGAPQPAAEPLANELRLTPAKLDAFIQYQRAMLGAYALTLRDVQRLSGKADAGTYAGASGAMVRAKDSMQMLKVQSELEEAARTSSGLSEAEADQIEALVSEVIATRTLWKTMGDRRALEQLTQMRDQLPADQRGALEESISQMNKQREALHNLTEARQKFGSENVDLVLSREEELSRQWKELMSLLTGNLRQ